MISSIPTIIFFKTICFHDIYRPNLLNVINPSTKCVKVYVSFLSTCKCSCHAYSSHMIRYPPITKVFHQPVQSFSFCLLQFFTNLPPYYCFVLTGPRSADSILRQVLFISFFLSTSAFTCYRKLFCTKIIKLQTC